MASAKNKRDSKKPAGRRGKWIIFFLSACIGISAAWLILNPAKVVVPAVVGMSEKQADALIRAAGLEIVVRSEKVGDKGRPGEVIRQIPEPRSLVPKMSVVTLIVGAGPEEITVPDLVGQTRSAAEDSLLRLGFKVSFVEVASASVPIGSVIEHKPGPGEKTFSGATVELTVSMGEGKEVVVPSLIGMTIEEAKRALELLNLRLIVIESVQEDFRDGDPKRVLRQEPEAGLALVEGSKVSVFLPIAPPAGAGPDTVDGGKNAPRLEGLTVAAARKLTEQQGIALELADSASDADTITFQEPPPGDPLQAASPSVLIRVSRSAVVPGLNGLDEAAARAKVQKAGLTIGAVKKAYGKRAGEVIDQYPSAGIEVVSGSSIDITITDPNAPSYSNSSPAASTKGSDSAGWVD